MAEGLSDDMTKASQKRKINVAIIGAGISGLAVANGLLQDAAQRYDVQLYERDSVAYELERGGYQLRIGCAALQALKSVLNDEAAQMLRKVWTLNAAKAPALVNPNTFNCCLDLARVKMYPQSRPILRPALRKVLLQRPLAEERIKFDHHFDRYELDAKPDSGVLLHFKDREPVHADLLIAADGSGSKINQQVGLNNRFKLQGYTLVQARGSISVETRNKLPSSLLTYGSLLLLGGRKFSGYASVSKQDDVLALEDSNVDQVEDLRDRYYLFWSVLVPAEKGESMIRKSGDENALLVRQLIDYVRHDLEAGEALPAVFESVRTNLRTGLLTSSFEPTTDWRKGKAANARIILLGDAVHPMTPGRGMGANQALVDASQLVDMLCQTDFHRNSPTDQELASLVGAFDAEMYSRAFPMVKASEQMTDLDLTSGWGRAKTAIFHAVLTVLGWLVSAAEASGLRKAENMEID